MFPVGLCLEFPQWFGGAVTCMVVKTCQWESMSYHINNSIRSIGSSLMGSCIFGGTLMLVPPIKQWSGSSVGDVGIGGTLVSVPLIGRWCRRCTVRQCDSVVLSGLRLGLIDGTMEW